MVRPASFGFNPETAASNAFAAAADCGDVLREFDLAVEQLGKAGLEIIVLDDQPDPATPDAIFPNNWVSFHADGTMVLYPMESPSRQAEREPERVRQLLESRGFEVRQVVDLSLLEQDGRFLEGTGSLILDRPARRGFASLSPRTHPEAIARFDERLGYSTFTFGAHDRSGRPIYHTNVLMSLGTSFAVLCLDAVADTDRAALVEEIAAGGRRLIEVDYEQMTHFACNIIELENSSGGPVIAISAAAVRSLRADQRQVLESFGELVPVEIPTIEQVGGGSIRCMIADIHLPRR